MHYRHKQVHCHTTERKKLVFTAALFARAQKWKQPKYPSTDEWIKTIWYIYTMEYYSAIKRDETWPFVETWINPESVVQSKVSQKEKNKYHTLTWSTGTTVRTAEVI